MRQRPAGQSASVAQSSPSLLPPPVQTGGLTVPQPGGTPICGVPVVNSRRVAAQQSHVLSVVVVLPPVTVVLVEPAPLVLVTLPPVVLVVPTTVVLDPLPLVVEPPGVVVVVVLDEPPLHPAG